MSKKKKDGKVIYTNARGSGVTGTKVGDVTIHTTGPKRNLDRIKANKAKTDGAGGSK